MLITRLINILKQNEIDPSDLILLKGFPFQTLLMSMLLILHLKYKYKFIFEVIASWLEL